MSSSYPLDTSAYSAISNSYFPVAPMDTLPTGTGRVRAISAQEESEKDTKQSPDFSSYYKNVIVPQESSEDAGTNLVQSAQVLDNAMVSALSNGYSVQSACNIRLAELAYKANARVFESTFELEV